MITDKIQREIIENFDILDDDIESFVYENFPGEISECFNKLNLMVGKVDLWRYLILFKNGGIYLDIDARTNSSFSNLIHKTDDAVITFENNFGSNIFAQWALIFNKNHPALKKVIEIVIDNKKRHINSFQKIGIKGVGFLQDNFTISVKSKNYSYF